MDPTWHREAKAQGLRHIVICSNMSKGLIFAPSDLNYPFLVGGGHQGAMPVSSKLALGYIEENLMNPFFRQPDWFFSYVVKVNNHIDFSLTDLKLDQRDVRIEYNREGN